MEVPKLAIVIPAYNEEETISLTIERMENLVKDYIERNILPKTKPFMMFQFNSVLPAEVGMNALITTASKGATNNNKVIMTNGKVKSKIIT